MSKSSEKKEFILEKATQVFIKNGFHNVTMKDIIEECGISRGGIYLYFSSTDEIFMEVIKRHNLSKAKEVKIDIEKNNSFEAMLANYFDMQKNRLLHMKNSLLLAMFEFFIAHKHEPDKDFFSGTFNMLEGTLYDVLDYGVRQKCLRAENLRVLSANVLFCIKGLETLAMSSGVSEELLNTQFEFIKKNILTRYGDSSHEE
ncbi:MAG: TetR/AcrR family transcriptional regulator [Oscillospiraceae bacterium]|nr:TetR/AcrR family transcriptional regulator [Oscillospiraceae bacterium]